MSVKTIHVTIPGAPMGKPRMTRSDKWKKRRCVVRYREWADWVRESVKIQVGELPPADSILSLSWVAYFEPPVSWKAKRAKVIGELHRKTPDRDNIDKALLDALFKEDSGIAAGNLEKRWDWIPRLELTIVFEPPSAA